MRKVFAVVFVLALLVAPVTFIVSDVFAVQLCPDGTSQPCNPVNNGGAGGSATSTNTNTNTNTNTLSNSQSQSSTNANVNSQDQKQKQKQKQSQSQANTQSTSVDASSHDDFPRQAPPAFAPGLVAAPETCMGAVAVGASSPFGGISFGTTYKSDDCELRMYARSLMALGAQYAPAAIALLAQNPNVQKALLASGMPIPGQKAEAAATVGSGAGGTTPAAAVSTSVPSPSKDESKVVCSNTQRKIRAGNGDYFCQPY